MNLSGFSFRVSLLGSVRQVRWYFSIGVASLGRVAKGRVAKGGLLSAVAALTVGSASASAQMIPNLESLNSSMFSQDLTDAVTQGFRQRDRTFFEEGILQFESIVNSLQHPEQPEAILVIEAVADDWQPFEIREVE